MKELPEGKDSTFVQGTIGPDWSKALVTPAGVAISLGSAPSLDGLRSFPLIDRNHHAGKVVNNPQRKKALSNYARLYTNEYVVYDERQCKMRYLVQVKFN